MQTTSPLNKKIILLNGPPGCGKDTVAQMLWDNHPSVDMLEKFARPLKETAPVLYGIDKDKWLHLDSHGVKDEPCEALFGFTPRQVQIHISETLLKPLHGKRVFGELCANRIENSPGITFVVSDCGFRDECEVLVERFGAENVLLVHIHREGCSYENDSRDWVRLTDLGVPTKIIENNGSLEDLEKEIACL